MAEILEKKKQLKKRQKLHLESVKIKKIKKHASSNDALSQNFMMLGLLVASENMNRQTHRIHVL